MYRFLTYVPDIDSALNDFWNVNEHKVKSWYKDRQKDDDIIISASPEFLLKPICERLGIKNLMASKVDKHTGLYDGETVGEKKRLNVFMRNFQMLNVRNFIPIRFPIHRLPNLRIKQ